MDRKVNPIILYYPSGVVHFRNLEILQQRLPGYVFRVIIEPWVLEKAPEVLQKVDRKNQVMLINHQLPPGAWDGVDMLFLSMAYPNMFRLQLIYKAAIRSIPVTAIEEVNQLALNDGIINHYFLPLDCFGVPSEIEKTKFLELGIRENSLMVTGWPFFDPSQCSEQKTTVHLKVEYNIPESKKLCLIILGSLKEFDIVSMETGQVRQQILKTVCKGLPDHYHLLIKPHPIETEYNL